MTAAPTPPRPTRRERLRADTLTEIKARAREQIAALGPQGLSLNAIAREMGMSGPAVYRYFASRGHVLDAVVADLYDELGDALEAAASAARRRTPPARLRALAEAYRGWALAHPREYRVMNDEASPAAGEHATRVPRASHRSMRLLVDALGAVGGPGAGAEAPPARDALSRSLRAWSRARGQEEVPVALLRLAVLAWSRMHGLVALELAGAFASMGLDAAALFRSEVDELAREAAALGDAA